MMMSLSPGSKVIRSCDSLGALYIEEHKQANGGGTLMTSQVYNVPVVLPALRKEESYHQLVDALEYLDAVATDIFNRVSCRVAESRDQLTAINNRVNVAQAKIDKLRNSSSKATRVFSPPKYPAPERISETTTVYQEVNPLLQRVRKTRVDIDSRLEEVTREVVVAKRHPFLLDSRKKKKPLDLQFASEDPEQGEGLGSLPRHLPSVSSLLLFNTSENPYKKYVLLDPLSGATIKTRDNLNKEEDKLTDAPVTITQGEELLSGPQDSVMYVPVMPELPELEVPELLPSLPYVAADMFYTADIGKSIAPSLANTTVPELPELADPKAPAATTAGEEQDAPPPPPPVPATPPPPTSVSLSSVDDDSSAEEEEGTVGEVGVGDDRATLMEAIRKAGGASKAGLKSAKERKRERKAKKEAVASTGGDLLGDLTAALGRRRKAMSGKDREKKEERREDHSLGGGSMMDNISKMIPVTNKPNAPGTASGEENEGEW